MANLISKDKVLEVAAKFIELAGDVKDSSAIEHLQSQIAQYRLGLFRIVVVGEVKKGKSSFINALLGEPGLLPTASDVATSTVYKLMYGSVKKIKVFFQPDPEKPEVPQPPLEITEDQLKDYGTEDGNPNNKKCVDFIGIQLPHPLLKDGVAIIDTPGLGGLFQKHRDITWRYIPNADAVFFVLDSVEAVMSKAEAEMLLALREKNPLIFFVQTKTDLVEEAQWTKWRERNLQIISDQLKVPTGKLIYFPVSAKIKFAADANHSPKHLDRSGYSALLYFLNNKLLAKKEDQLGRRLLFSLSTEAVGIHRKLSDSIQIAATETKEGLDSLERSFIEAKTKYEQWKGSDFQSALTAFQDKATELKRRTREAFQEQLDPSQYSPLVSSIINPLRELTFDPKEMNARADDIVGECIDHCSSIVMDVQGRYNDDVHGYVQELAVSIGKSLPLTATSVVSGVKGSRVDSLNMTFDSFQDLSSRALGASRGSLMVGLPLTAVGIVLPLIGVAFPPLAIAAAGIATLVSMGYGAKKGGEEYTEKRKDEALARLQNVLCDNVRKAQQQAFRQFDAISAEYDKGVRDALHKATAEVEKEIADKMQSISEQRQRSRDEAKEKAVDLRQMLDRTNGFLQVLARYSDPISEKL